MSRIDLNQYNPQRNLLSNAYLAMVQKLMLLLSEFNCLKPKDLETISFYARGSNRYYP